MSTKSAESVITNSPDTLWSEDGTGARKRLNGRGLVFHHTAGQAWQFDEQRFGRFAAFAAESGATHVQVSLPFRYNSWVLPDNRDPYAAWCVNSVGVLRVCPPPELQEWVPLEQAREAQSLLQAQLAILRKYGLKAVAHAVEPMWLPEGVYRANPQWRGAQCELGRIAEKPYFAPSLDNPEVLDLYRRAMTEFATLFPEIEQFSFLSNDSGAGVAWSPCLYPGMNGPVAYRRRDGGERIAQWLKVLQGAAGAAGVTVRFNVQSSGLPPEWVSSARQRLDPGLFVCGGNTHGEHLSVAGAGMAGGMWSDIYPARGLAHPGEFLAGLQNIYHNPDGEASFANLHVEEGDLELARLCVKTFLANPGRGLRHRVDLMLAVAEALTGSPQAAERLISVWDSVSQARQAMRQIQQKGFSHAFTWCAVSARWLVRPLVPRPEQLTDAEKAHYRDFIFAIEEQKDDPRLNLVLGKGVFRGESVTWLVRWCLHGAISSLKSARRTVLELADKAGKPAASNLELYAARIGVLACLGATVKNCIMYQYALDTIEQPQYGPNPMDYDDNIIYDMRALNLRKIAREELDNIAELRRLIATAPGEVIEYAAAPEEQNVFMLGPDLPRDLERKMDIMMDHWQEYEQLYPTTKVWDFEPQPTGNIAPPTQSS